jgi:hypothetical protein
VQADIDTVVAADGDLLRIPRVRRREVLLSLSVLAKDPCNVFGT